MPNAIKQFIAAISTTLVALGFYKLVAVLYPDVRHSGFYLVLLAFFLQEVLSWYFLRKWGEDREKFMWVFLAITAARLIITMVISILVVSMVEPHNDLLTIFPGLLFIYSLFLNSYFIGRELRGRARFR